MTTQPETLYASSALRELESSLNESSFTSLWEKYRLGSKEEALVPVLWKWSIVERFLQRSGELVDIGRADDPNDRRVICYTNPAMKDSGSTSKTIQFNVQLVKPGEIGECHRHTQNAMRFVLDASGDIYSNVDGEKMLMEPGDLVLTPNWSWHDHTNNAAEPAVWLDILDSPLTNALGGHFKDVWTDGVMQPVIHPDGYSRQRFASVRPRMAETRNGAVPYVYKWNDAEVALYELHRSGEPVGPEGIVADLVNAATGADTFPTLHCRMHLLPAHSSTPLFRRTGVCVYYVFRGGSGSLQIKAATQVKGERTPSPNDEDMSFDWGERDSFMVPSWHWQQLRNDSDEDVVLFSTVDSPSLRAFGWYREEVLP